MIYCSCSRKIRKIRTICFKKFTIPNVVDRSRLFWRRTATHFRCQCTTKGNVCRWKEEKFLCQDQFSPTMTFAFIMTLNLYNITSSDSWSVWFCTWEFPKMSYSIPSSLAWTGISYSVTFAQNSRNSHKRKENSGKSNLLSSILRALLSVERHSTNPGCQSGLQKPGGRRCCQGSSSS